MAQKRKHYSKQFKIDAVKLITEQGYKISEAAHNLGLHHSSLRRWKNQLETNSTQAFPDKGHMTPEKEELYRLHKEVKQLRMEREILKNGLRYAHPPMILETSFIVGGRGRPLNGVMYPLKNVAQE